LLPFLSWLGQSAGFTAPHLVCAAPRHLGRGSCSATWPSGTRR